MMRLGYILALSSAVFWALAAICYDLLNQKNLLTHSFQMVFALFFLVESVIFGTLCVIHQKAVKQWFCSPYFAGIFAGIIGGPLGMFCYLNAIEQISAASAAPISATYPIWGAIFSMIWLKVRLNYLSFLGFLLVVGSSILVSLNAGAITLSYVGILLAVFSAICWGSEIVISAYIMKKISAKQAYFYRQFGVVIGYLFLVLSYLSSLSDLSILFDQRSVIFLLLLIIVFSMLSYYFYYESVYRLNPIHAMVLNSTYGFWIIILSYFFFKQQSFPINITYILCVLIGLIFVFMSNKETK
ncbi:hypothetical protein A4G18_03695 [Pasteurellaceae bacterium Pebbles2]|nr:hypothetical protein [Pasteurellaceae bacterium Pebbles2]